MHGRYQGSGVNEAGHGSCWIRTLALVPHAWSFLCHMMRPPGTGMRPLTSPMFAVDSKSDVTGDRLCSSITPEVGSPGSAGAEVRTKQETWSKACVWDQQTWHLLPRRPCRWTRPCQLRGCEEHQRTECRYEERSAQLVVREDIIRVVRHPRVNEVFHMELSRALVALCRRFSGRLIPHPSEYCCQQGYKEYPDLGREERGLGQRIGSPLPLVASGLQAPGAYQMRMERSEWSPRSPDHKRPEILKRTN